MLDLLGSDIRSDNHRHGMHGDLLASQRHADDYARGDEGHRAQRSASNYEEEDGESDEGDAKVEENVLVIIIIFGAPQIDEVRSHAAKEHVPRRPKKQKQTLTGEPAYLCSARANIPVLRLADGAAFSVRHRVLHHLELALDVHESGIALAWAHKLHTFNLTAAHEAAAFLQ